jgi:RNA polymerase sigma factor (sigma-70 family)
MSALPSLGRADQAALGADATRTLYERHGSRIYAYCRSRLGTREEAEDAMQTTFLNAFRSLRGGLVPEFELAWLFRIADNVCRDRRKSAWRRGRLEAVTDLQDLQDVVAAPERAPDALEGLGEALTAMPERQRRAIMLREWQGLSYAEIATELGVSVAAVETLIFRARRSLARGLEAPLDRRKRAGLDVGSLLGLAKSLFTGGGAAKLAVSAAVVAGAGLVAVAPLRERTPVQPSPRVSVPPATAPRVSGPAQRSTPRPAVAPPGRRSITPARSAQAPPAGDSPETARASVPPTAPAGKASRPPTAAPPKAQPSAQPATPPPAPVASPPAPPPPTSVPDLPAVPPLPPVTAPAVPPLPEVPLDVPELPPLPPLTPLP